MSRVSVVIGLCAVLIGLAAFCVPAAPVRADATPPVGPGTGCPQDPLSAHGANGCPETPPTVAPVTVAVSTTEKVPGSAGGVLPDRVSVDELHAVIVANPTNLPEEPA